MRYYPIIATRNTNRGAMTAGIRTTGDAGYTHTTRIQGDGRWIALDMRQESITTPSRRKTWATTDGTTIVTRDEAIQAWEDILNPKTANNTGLLAYVDAMKAETIADADIDAHHAHELMEFFLSKDGGVEWLALAARRFTGSDSPYSYDQAIGIITHETMKDTPDNRRNGYLPYTTPQEMWSRTMHAFS